MQIILNILIYLFLFIFFSLSILGYGALLKRITINEKVNHLGETAFFGFIALYLISVTTHFFLNLNLFLTLGVLIFGFLLSVKHLKKNSFLKEYSNYFKIVFFLTFLLLGASNNPHDDAYLYQLPYLSYLQNEKLVFGLININEFTAYSKAFYDIMGLFKLPVLGNQAVYLLPTIFFMFFFIFLIENYKKKSNTLKLLIYSIFVLALIKFTRSKEFGTDIPAIAIIFAIQIYLLKFLETKEYNLINKAGILLVFAFFVNSYTILASIYFLILSKYLIKFFFTYQNYFKPLILIILIITLSIFKNIAHSGCVSYPIKLTCFDKNLVNWGNGHKLVELRNDGLMAGAKGIKAFVRSNERTYDIISSTDYLKKFKYTYHLNVIKDPDFKRLLIVFFILNFFLIMSLLNRYFTKIFTTNIKINNISLLELTILITPMILWWILIPVSKYGGYAYFLFGIYSIYSYFDLYKNINFKHVKILCAISFVFFLSKNFNRINDEYTDGYYSTINYPLPSFEYQKFKIETVNNETFYVTENLKRCGDIKFPCLERAHFDGIKSAKRKNGYLFVEGLEEKQIESYKIEQNWGYNTNNY